MRIMLSNLNKRRVLLSFFSRLLRLFAIVSSASSLLYMQVCSEYMARFLSHLLDLSSLATINDFFCVSASHNAQGRRRWRISIWAHFAHVAHNPEANYSRYCLVATAILAE